MTINPASHAQVLQNFQWIAEPVITPNGAASGSMNLQYSSGPYSLGNLPQETGFSVSANGSVNTPKLFVSQPAGTVASPYFTIQADDDAVARNAAQQLVIQRATDPRQQLLIGYQSLNSDYVGGYATIQATWQGVENSPLLMQPNGDGGCVCIRTGNQALANPLVVGQGQGYAVADSWATYSSRRFKANIQTLPDALGKVEQLRGVSYTLKATGKHEIGVIAEEVGKVVPEVVTYEANGVDARAVDYTRLTALLIEATKKQQKEITDALRQIKSAQATIHKQAATIVSLKAQVNDGAKSLKEVKAQLANRQIGQERTALVGSRQRHR
jgi:hypothetical protein